MGRSLSTICLLLDRLSYLSQIDSLLVQHRNISVRFSPLRLVVYFHSVVQLQLEADRCAGVGVQSDRASVYATPNDYTLEDRKVCGIGPCAPLEDRKVCGIGGTGPCAPVEDRKVCGIGPCAPVEDRKVGGIGPCAPVEDRKVGGIGPCAPLEDRKVCGIGPCAPVEDRKVGGIGPCAPLEDRKVCGIGPCARSCLHSEGCLALSADKYR